MKLKFTILSHKFLKKKINTGNPIILVNFLHQTKGKNPKIECHRDCKSGS